MLEKLKNIVKKIKASFTSKKWLKVVLIPFLILTIFIIGVNYIVDPYGLYNTNIVKFPKVMQAQKMRLIKARKTKEIKPVSIVLGTSRAEYGYDPTHPYFTKPSYNLATSGSSMYENLKYFKYALEQGNLKKVLLVLDFRMISSVAQRNVGDFETYFKNKDIYAMLFSYDTLGDSWKTIKGKNKNGNIIYLENGQFEHNIAWKNISNYGGHLKRMLTDEKSYYKDFDTEYKYKDTKKDAFLDLDEMIRLSYENNVQLDIIFGPSHIRQWEAFAYYQGYDTWLKYKKDVVLIADKIAKEYNKNQYRVMDFAVYHKLTSEKVPVDKDVQMKYHWEGSHYKHELGLIVLDRLSNIKTDFEDFGVELNINNIDEHLNNLKNDRNKFIDVEKWKQEVFGEEKTSKE